MAKNALDPCIICEQLKCRCGKPPEAPKVTKPRKRSPKPEAAVPPAAVPQQPVEQPSSTEDPLAGITTQKASARAAMKARAARSNPARPAIPAPPPRDEVMEDAIRACAPIMAGDEKPKYGNILWDRPSEIDQRALAWKMRMQSRG